MKTQAWGWLAAAVLAAGLNASYHDGGLQWAHRVVNQVGHNTNAVLALATGNADRFVTEARLVTGPRELTPCRFAAVMARAQDQALRSDAQVVRFEAMSDRQAAQLERLAANRARMEAQLVAVRIPQISFASVAVRAPRVVCPRVRVNIPRLPQVTMPTMPAIHIEAPGSGPV
jgi:hypothetical protein